YLILRQLDDEEGLPALVAGDLVDQQGAQENKHDAGEVHEEAYPAGIVKESTGKQGDDGDLRATGHEGGQHGGGPALPLVADGAAGHDAGDGTAGADDEGDDGLTGQANLFEDGVQHYGHAGHIAAVLQQGDEEVHDHHQGKETNHGAHAADDAVGQQRGQQRIGVSQQHLADVALEGF